MRDQHFINFLADKCSLKNREEIIKLQKNYQEAAKVFSKYKNENDLNTLARGVNLIAAIYNQHEEETQAKIAQEDFNDVNGLDFNEYYHDQEYLIKGLWWDLSDLYHEKHFELNGWNSYNV